MEGVPPGVKAKWIFGGPASTRAGSGSEAWTGWNPSLQKAGIQQGRTEWNPSLQTAGIQPTRMPWKASLHGMGNQPKFHFGSKWVGIDGRGKLEYGIAIVNDDREELMRAMSSNLNVQARPCSMLAG